MTRIIVRMYEIKNHWLVLTHPEVAGFQAPRDREFTQGEVWEVTNPMLSWRDGYVGDTLFRSKQRRR